MRTTWAAASVLVGGTLGAPSAIATDLRVLGSQLTVKNGSTPAQRRIVATGGGRSQSFTIFGNPDAPGSGATLTVILNGTNPSSQSFPLPQGTGATRPFWGFVAEGGAGGYRYRDQRGEQGPVRSLIFKQTVNHAGVDRTVFKVVIRASNGPIDVAPPNPGTDAFVTLEMWNGPRYCLQFGPDSLVIDNRGDRFFRVKDPQSRACPPTTTTSSTTTTTLYGMPSRAFVVGSGDLLD